MPRVVAGLEKLSVDSLTVKVAAEFTNDVPSRLLAAKRAIPGWGKAPITVDSDAPISVGIGAHVGAMLELARTELRESRDRAFACEELQQIPQSASEVLAMTQFVPPVVSDLTGARFSFENMRTGQTTGAAAQPATTRFIDAWLMLRTPDPQSLLATVSTFAPPEIQSLQVKPDGEPVEIPFPPDQPAPFESLKIMMTADSIGLTTSDALLPKAQSIASAPAEGDTPMIAVAVDIGRVMATVMNPMGPAPGQQAPESAPFFVTVDPTDKAIVTTVRVPLKSLMSGSLP
jgi:hypothetical protein